MGISCHCSYLLTQGVLKEQEPTQYVYIIVTLCFSLCYSNHKVEEYTSSNNNKASDFYLRKFL